MRSIIAVGLLVSACVQPDTAAPSPGALGVVDPVGVPEATASCLQAAPTGDIQWVEAIAPAVYYQPSRISTDLDGNVLYAHNPLNTWQGVSKYDNDGVELFHRNFGEQVTTDAEGNIYLAGIQYGPTDFGLGVVPQGSEDPSVYVVKMDASGRTQWVKVMGPCGELEVTGLAVARDGRIAVSARTLGTWVLDGAGEKLWSRPLSGSVAFDSHGDLMINGTVNNDWVFAKLSPSGAELLRMTFTDRPGSTTNDPQLGRQVVVDRDDNIILSGWSLWTGTTLFGVQWVGGFYSSGDPINLGFVIKLDNAGNRIWNVFVPAETVEGLAVDPLGNVVVSSSELGIGPSHHKPEVQKLDARNGDMIWYHAGIPALPIPLGDAWGVATDPCGNTFWQATMPLPANLGGDYYMHLVKIGM